MTSSWQRSRKYPAQTITDADCIALLTNAPAQAETLLQSLERAVASIGLHVNTHKTEYMCFNQRDDISTLNGSSLKLVDKFTYIGSSVSSTNTDINTQLAMAVSFIATSNGCFIYQQWLFHLSQLAMAVSFSNGCFILSVRFDR